MEQIHNSNNENIIIFEFKNWINYKKLNKIKINITKIIFNINLLKLFRNFVYNIKILLEKN